MSVDQPRNLAASVRQRLFNIAKRDGEAFDLVLTRQGNADFPCHAFQGVKRQAGITACMALRLAVWSGTSAGLAGNANAMGLAAGRTTAESQCSQAFPKVWLFLFSSLEVGVLPKHILL